MGVSERDVDHLAVAILSAQRPLVLAGQRLDVAGIEDVKRRRGEWSQQATLEILLTDPAGFWKFFLPIAQQAADRTPGPAHDALARLQTSGILDGVITQSADGLLERAGVHSAVEVYGNILHAVCTRCSARYSLEQTTAFISAAPDGVPRCRTDGCAYPLRPDGTLWNEALPDKAVKAAWALAESCDLLVIVDSDLRTAPIALLPSVPLAKQVRVIIVGPYATHYDRYAHQVIRVPAAANTLSALAERVTPKE